MRFAVASLLVLASVAQAADTYSWRYYRPTNTGIQGDSCEALKIGPDGNPWIAGYVASFEEGGIAKFIQSENRWLNISNVDYPEIGHPEFTAISRVSDIDTDAAGRMWMATGRGALFYDPAVGPSSLRRYGDDNSQIPGGWNRGVEVAPDGTVWFSAYSTVWGNGGVSRYNPATNTWQVFSTIGDGAVALQPLTGGQYYVWVHAYDGGELMRYSSQTAQWTTLPKINGNPAKLIGKNVTDAAGNMWAYRWTDATLSTMRLDLLRPNGTWANVPAAPFDSQFNSAHAIRALSANRAVMVDGGGTAYSYDNGIWTSLGMWDNNPWTSDVDIDPAGNVWVCAEGGAAKRSAQTGQWQRYRITNTSQYDFFNNDFSLGADGSMIACANAAPGYGGAVAFDGKRWTGFNNHHYGLGVNWPFPTDSSNRVYIRRSTQQRIFNPMYEGYHAYTGTGFQSLGLPFSSPSDMVEDSLGRLWATYPGGLYRRDGLVWNLIDARGGDRLVRDPKLAGTIWSVGMTDILRTNGITTFARTVADFPELDTQSDQFHGLAIAPDGSAWVGGYTVNLPSNSCIFKINPTSGTYRAYRNATGWPFPGEYAMPLAATHDGRIWMQYDSDYLTAQRGLFWFDGRQIGQFPAPPNGEMQWGGLPHAQIGKIEVRYIRDGYELWMNCASRGLAVLTVKPPKIGRK